MSDLKIILFFTMFSRVSTAYDWHSILIANGKCIGQTSATFWYCNAIACVGLQDTAGKIFDAHQNVFILLTISNPAATLPMLTVLVDGPVKLWKGRERLVWLISSLKNYITYRKVLKSNLIWQILEEHLQTLVVQAPSCKFVPVK